MMINSLSALISMRKSRLSLKRQINWSSVRLRDRTFKTTRTAVSICIAGGLAMFSPHDDHNYRRVFEQFLRRSRGSLSGYGADKTFAVTAEIRCLSPNFF